MPPLQADERTTVESWLDFYRATLGNKCEGLADHAAMGEGRDALSGVPRGQPFDRRPYAAGEGAGGFGAGNYVPALFRRHAQGGRMALSYHLAEHAAFPVAEVHLPQPGFNGGNEAEFGGQRRSGLRGPAHRGDVDRLQPGAREPRAHQPGLVMALMRQRRITLAIDQGKRRAFDVGSRLAVPHQQDVGSARRRLDAALPECGRFRLGAPGIGHEENIPVSRSSARSR